MTLLERDCVSLRSMDGDVVPLDVARWFGEPSEAEREVLARALAPVLDVGCGPARHTLALRRLGVEALGVDVSAAAVRTAHRRGAPVVHADVFRRLPDEGSWGSVLLLDGNIGIGGDPSLLLERVRRIVRRGGRALVEVEPPGSSTWSMHVRIERGRERGAWFPWAGVSADDVEVLARSAGFRLAEVWGAEARWFGRLEA